MKRAILLASALLAATAAHAAEPKIGRVALTLPDSQEFTDEFKADAPKIVLHAELLDVPAGSKVGAAWIAAEVDGVEADYKIDAAVVDVGEDGAEEATFTLSKPDAGWPVGAYRVDIDIDDVAMESADFSIVN
jgi:hypothetical protein